MGIVTLEKKDSIYTLEMVDEKHKNSFTNELVEQLIQALDKVQKDTEVKVLLIRGLKDVFLSGATRQELEFLHREYKTNTQALNYFSSAIIRLPIPVVMAMEGHAVGGGFAVALCGDIIIAAEESRYGFNFMDIGITPGMASTSLIHDIVSYPIAMEMLMTGDLRKGEELKGKCAFNYILPKEDVLTRSQEIAYSLTEKSRRILELLKRRMSVKRLQAYEEAKVVESFMHVVAFAQPEVEDSVENNFHGIDVNEK